MRTMNKLKIAGIIIAVMAASVFVFLYFTRPHTVENAVLVLLAGGCMVIGLIMIAVSDEADVEDADER